MTQYAHAMQYITVTNEHIGYILYASSTVNSEWIKKTLSKCTDYLGK